MRVNFANSLLKYRRLLPVAIEHSLELRLSYKVSTIEIVTKIVVCPDLFSASVRVKNQYLKAVIDKMVYGRDPIVPITKENAEKFGVETLKGMNYCTPPYKITISLKCD